MTRRRLGLTLIGNWAKTCSKNGILDTATQLASNWREA